MEPLSIRNRLDNVMFAVVSMVELLTTNGSHERGLARMVEIGIRGEIDAIVAEVKRLIPEYA